MNTYIKNQIDNMLMITKTFEQSCDLAAMQDDGMKNREEQKQLKKIHAAAEKFRKELESIK